MGSLQQNQAIEKLPVAELRVDLGLFLQPVLRRLSEKRMRVVGDLAVQGTPRPIPKLLVEYSGSNIFSICSSSMPGPLS